MNSVVRLAIWVAGLLILPALGLWISGMEWNVTGVNHTGSDDNLPATLLTTLMLLGYILLANHVASLYTGSHPLNSQRNFFIAVAAASAVLGWLLVYLNLFVDSWSPTQGQWLLELLLYTPLFALLAPAVLVTRAVLGSFGNLLKWLARGPALPAANAEAAPYSLIALSILGLLGGAALPEQLFSLLWLSPLLLLSALQLLWQESTIFSALKSGDWGRMVCAALSGVAVGNIAVATYAANGGSLAINISGLHQQLGYAAFGLLCLQLGDILAENWRGKKRSTLFQQKKKFPIPVVVKKK
jgi:hypothetical protein